MTKIVGAALRVVEDERRPAKDIYAEDRERIAAIDWAEVHVRGDRSRAVDLPNLGRKRPSGLGGW